MTQIGDEVHFKQFALSLNFALDARGRTLPKDLLEKQYQQLSTLISLETQLRKKLIQHRSGNKAYRDFVKFICNENKNILSARPFFRERHSVFSKKISSALKKRNEKSLYKFRFNYVFIAFLLRSQKFSENSDICKIARKIEELRKEIMEMNTPLAISQCRIFWANTPKSHLSFMDLVQIHCGGLLVAIDKFVPPSTRGMKKRAVLAAFRKFRAVAIGRMIGDRIESYSETMVHFYPADKRKIYRANKLLRKFKEGIDFAKLSRMVNKDVDPGQKTNPEEIARLLASSSHISADTTVNEEQESILERTVDIPDKRFDEVIETKQTLTKVHECIRTFSTVEQKIMKMKGINNEQNL